MLFTGGRPRDRRQAEQAVRRCWRRRRCLRHSRRGMLASFQPACWCFALVGVVGDIANGTDSSCIWTPPLLLPYLLTSYPLPNRWSSHAYIHYLETNHSLLLLWPRTFGRCIKNIECVLSPKPFT